LDRRFGRPFPIASAIVAPWPRCSTKLSRSAKLPFGWGLALRGIRHSRRRSASRPAKRFSRKLADWNVRIGGGGELVTREFAGQWRVDVVGEWETFNDHEIYALHVLGIDDPTEEAAYNRVRYGCFKENRRNKGVIAK
jgi:hypothetical protein